MEKLDHIAIVTPNLDETIPHYEKLFGVEIKPPVFVPDQGVLSALVPLEGVGIELFQPTDPEGGIQKFLDKHGPGIHHIALHVDNLDAAVEKYTAAGIKLIVGTANGNKSVFIHPKSTGGVLIELCD